MKYVIRRNFRTKEVIIWMILFPVVLGTLYKFTMGNLGKENHFSTVPAAVVENEKDQLFHWIMDAMNNGTFSEANDQTCRFIDCGSTFDTFWPGGSRGSGSHRVHSEFQDAGQ